MSLSAQDWLRNFYSEFLDICEAEENFGKRVTNGKWTKTMKEFLANLGQKLGYEVKGERLRIDQMWKKQGETIAIEHEITDEGIFEKEIPNLMSVKAHLRVLITYVRDYQFPYKAVETADKVKIALSHRDSEFDEGEEFLLVIGTKTPKRRKKGKRGKRLRDFMSRHSDWLAYRFHPIFKPEIKADVLQTTKTGLRSEAARKAWATRKARIRISH